MVALVKRGRGLGLANVKYTIIVPDPGLNGHLVSGPFELTPGLHDSMSVVCPQTAWTHQRIKDQSPTQQLDYKHFITNINIL